MAVSQCHSELGAEARQEPAAATRQPPAQTPLQDARLEQPGEAQQPQTPGS